MAKRHTDTDKWKKPFIRAMKTPYKLLWLYILDECDHAGIWQVDLDVAQIKIGEKLKLKEAIDFFSEKILVFDEGKKWFIFDFLEFQYGILNPENRVHASVMHILDRHGIDFNKPLIKALKSPIEDTMDIYKDKDKDKDKGGLRGIKVFAPPTLEEFKLYFFEHGYRPEVAERAHRGYAEADWKDSKGKKVLNWKQKVNHVWFKDENISTVSNKTKAPDTNSFFGTNG